MFWESGKDTKTNSNGLTITHGNALKGIYN